MNSPLVVAHGYMLAFMFCALHETAHRTAFRTRWRAHGALGMRLPRWRNVARYTQCDRIDVPPGIPGALAYDGVAVVLFRSEAARLAHIADPDGRITKADESETFARPVRETAALTQPCELLPHRPDAPTRLFLLHRVVPDFAPAVFLAQFGCGFERNSVRSGAPNELGLDAIDEVSIPDCSDLPTILSRLLQAWQLESLSWIATEECVLYPPVATAQA